MENHLISKAYRWNLIGSIFKSGSGFIVNVVLARILGPEPFGIIAIVNIFLSIGNLIIESGLSAGLIQKKEIDKRDITFIFTIQIIAALVFCVIYLALAPVIANYYKQPVLLSVMSILSLCMLFQAASQTSTALLKRNYSFDRIQQAQIISFIFYAIIGLWLAYAGFGVWSLVYAQLATTLSYLIIIFMFEHHPIGFNLHDSGGLAKFGLKILGGNIANWTLGNFDNTSISLKYGVTNLGLYSRAWTLAYMPISIFVSSAQGVLFTASSKTQDDLEQVRKLFLGVFSIFGQLLFPYTIFIALEADAIIRLVYGEKWLSAIPFFAILAVAMPFFSLMAIQGPILAGIGKPQIELKIQWITVAFMVIILLIAINFSIEIFIVSVLIVYIFRFCLFTVISCKNLLILKEEMIASAGYILIHLLTVGTIMAVFHFSNTNFAILVRVAIQLVILLTGEALVTFLCWKRFTPNCVKYIYSIVLTKTKLSE
jgi:lipopolysaccharide exporter